MVDRPDPTQRFSNRVKNYELYRPGYPQGVYEILQREAGLRPGDLVADLGSGTGLLSKLFVDRGHTVYAIEPNAEMRAAAEALFAEHPTFVSVDGRAEKIPLADESVDLVVAGQAFHWFEPTAARREMRRVLRAGQQVALIWNRRGSATPFNIDYEALLDRFGTDFRQVDQQRKITDEGMAAFFAPQPMHKASLPNHQDLDADGLRGRLLSSSYTPVAGDAKYQSMLAALDDLFQQYQRGGQVRFDYETVIYYGQL